MGFPLTDEPPPQSGNGPPDQPPEGNEPRPGGPAPRKGLSTVWIVALVIVALILLAFGICVTVVR